MYEVIVGNVGIVYDGDDFEEATRNFESYVVLSKERIGRAAGEDVTLFVDGEPEKEHFGEGER